jgi:hypothetical protein
MGKARTSGRAHLGLGFGRVGAVGVGVSFRSERGELLHGRCEEDRSWREGTGSRTSLTRS